MPMKKRISYEAPEVELILVQFEGNLAVSPNDDPKKDSMESYHEANDPLF